MTFARNLLFLKILTIIGKWIIHVKATPITGVENYRHYWYCNIFSLQANWQSWRAMCALLWRYGDVREQILWIFIIWSLWATFRICSRSTADEMRAFIQISNCDELGIKRMPLPSITTSSSLPMSKIICLSTPHSWNCSNWSFAKKKWNCERVSKCEKRMAYIPPLFHDWFFCGYITLQNITFLFDLSTLK